MASAGEIADLITAGMRGPTGPEDAGFHTGVIRSWSITTGINTVEVNGVILSNLKALQAGIGIRYTAGDVVVIMRKQTQYFVMGKVSAPGGTAGSAILGRSETDTTTLNTAGVWTSNSGAACSLSAYVGSSRWMLIMCQAQVTVERGARGYVGFSISGASTFSPGGFAATRAWTSLFMSANPDGIQVQTENSVVLQYAAGPALLNSGVNTVELKYYLEGCGGDTDGAISATFREPCLTLIPL